jgi:hypothetical protein
MKARYVVACALLALIWHHICLNLREAVDFIKSVYAGVVIGPDHSQPILPHLDPKNNQWLWPETAQLPPGEELIALPFFSQEIEDELPFAAGGSVIGPDHSQPILPHLDNQWLASDPDMPPGEQHTALPPYLRPMPQYHIQGVPLPLQADDELAFAA